MLNHEEKEGTVESLDSPEVKAVKYAGFWMRFWAFLIDYVVVSSLNRFVIFPFFKWKEIDFGPADIFSVEGLINAIVLYVYFVVMTKLTSQTLGKMVLNIKVESTTEQSLTWSTVIFREFIGKWISKVLFAGYIAVAFTKRKQGFHDYFADTVVVHADLVHVQINPSS